MDHVFKLVAKAEDQRVHTIGSDTVGELVQLLEADKRVTTVHQWGAGNASIEAVVSNEADSLEEGILAAKAAFIEAMKKCGLPEWEVSADYTH